MKKCQYCGDDFLPREATQKHCSRFCSTQFYAAERRAGVELLRRQRQQQTEQQQTEHPQ
jgi:hypothetical protein